MAQRPTGFLPKQVIYLYCGVSDKPSSEFASNQASDSCVALESVQCFSEHCSNGNMTIRRIHSGWNMRCV